MFDSMLQGALVSGSMIIAIGSQNAYILKQGLLNNYIFYIVSICFISDFILMTMGIFGIGQIVSQSLLLTRIMSTLGALFLIYYGTYSFKNAYIGNNNIEINNKSKTNLKKTVILTTLALTYLNPHVYLDTVVIIGGIAGTLSFEKKIFFLIGALISSFIWFFSLGYGAKYLLPLFKKKYTWVILDFIIGLIMYTIAYMLLVYLYQSFLPK